MIGKPHIKHGCPSFTLKRDVMTWVRFERVGNKFLGSEYKKKVKMSVVCAKAANIG